MTNSIETNKEILQFQASWDEKNASLKSSFLEKICRVVFYPIYRLAMLFVLPGQALYSKKEYDESSIKFNATYSTATIHPLEVTTPDGALLRGKFIQRAGLEKNAPVVIFFQNNGTLSTQSSCNWMIRQAAIENYPYNFIIWDYRNVGGSESCPTCPQQLILDGDSILQFATKKLNIDPKTIGFYGHSLGGAIAAKVKELHTECEGFSLLDRPFASLTEMVKLIVERVFSNSYTKAIASTLISWLGLNELNAAQSLKTLKGKTIVTYHADDQTVPLAASLATHADPTLQDVHVMQLSHQRWISDRVVNNTRLYRSHKQYGEKDEINRKDHAFQPHGAPLPYFATIDRSLAAKKCGEILFGGRGATSDAEWLEMFSRSSSSEKDRVYKTVSKLFQNKGLYWQSGEDAFHNRNGLSLTDSQRVEAIRHTFYKDSFGRYDLEV